MNVPKETREEWHALSDTEATLQMYYYAFAKYGSVAAINKYIEEKEAKAREALEKAKAKRAKARAIREKRTIAWDTVKERAGIKKKIRVKMTFDQRIPKKDTIALEHPVVQEFVQKVHKEALELIQKRDFNKADKLVEPHMFDQLYKSVF
jgi:hypothetical protein